MPLYLGQDDAGTSSYSLQDFEPSWGTKMNAAVRESWLESYGPAATDYLRSRVSQGDEAKLSAVDAANEIKQSGVKLNKSVGDGQYTKTQLAVLLERQRELTAIKDVRERTPWDMSSPIRGVGMFAAGIADPINLATAFVPWTKSLSILNSARAGLMAESFATRTLSRAAIGGADAAISTAVLEPAYFGIRNEIGDDYGALDSMANIAFGTAFGGGLHVLGGAAGDAFKMRRGGMVTPNPVAEPIAPPPGTVPGGETRIRIGETYEPARWSVIDADQLTATVDKADNQFRDRTRAAYQTEIQQRANNIDFNLLADSPVMDYGAPTLAADGRIIGGNGRALFISRAYEIGKGNDYRAGLEARMVEMGIDPDAVRGMSKPVLVRVLQREVDVKRAAMLSNEGGSTDMSPLEQAKVDAERLGDARLQVSADGVLDAPENRAAIRRWVEAQPENKRNGLVDEDGKLSATGIQRLNGALLFQAYGDSPVLGRLIESMDPGSRNLAAALGRTAPVLANARGAIATGDLHPLDIAGDIQLAVEKFNALRESGMKVADYLAQLDAFETGMTPESLALLDFMGRNIASPRRMADAITGFYDRLTEAGNPKQADMFGAGAVPDKAAMLDASIRAAEQGVDTAAEVAAGLAPETREATLRASVAQSVDGRMVDVDAIVGMDESLNTASRADALAAADRNFQPEAVALADFDASAEVQARVDAAPKWEGVKDAETALAEADALLADTVKAGEAAFRYSREIADQTQTPEFKNWFDGSKVVDADGKPMFTYHASTSPIDVFKPKNYGTAGDHSYFYFAASESWSKKFAKESLDVEKPSMHKVYLSIKNPLDLRGDIRTPSQWVEFFDGIGVELSDKFRAKLGAAPAKQEIAAWQLLRFDTPENGAMRERLIEAGYDGIVMSDVVRGKMDNTTFVAFRPTQIKSATGNRGTFDPANPNILYSRGITGQAAAEHLTEAIRLSFGKSTEALLAAGRIKLVGTVDEIPGGPHPRDVHGATDRLGNVYIVAENATEEGMKGLILHEVGVHAGMEKMLGPKLFDEILTDLDDALLRGEEWAIRARSYVPEKTPADMVREEQLAYLVQSAPDLPISKRIIAAVRAWFYRTFEFARERMTLTEGDFQALAVSALRYSGRWADLHADMMTHYARVGNMEGYSRGGDTFKEVRAGETVDGRIVREDVPNMGSIGSSLDDYTIIPGIRSVSMSVFDAEYIQSISYDRLDRRTKNLADEIKNSKEINPLIIAMDADGAYVIEGGHRFDALIAIGAKELPAVIVIDEANPPATALRYSRGDVPDPSTAKDELKPYDDAVKRAKGYASVLRAAADKLENDAQATDAMRAAMPDITPAEITDLLDQLRRQVKGLRGVARTARTMMGAEDVAAGLQADAMKAADTLANNLEMAAVIEKRNAALNMNARLKAASYINQFREAKLDFEGFRGLLVGTERKRAGGRISVEAEQKNFRGEWLGGMIADLEKGDLMRQFTSGDFDRDVSVALHNMGKGLDNSKLSPEAVKIAEIVNKYQTDARNTRNRFGAWIRDLNGYITRQTHDMFKIRDAGEKAFKEFVLPRLDLERSLRDFDGTADDFLTRVYDDFAAGSHMKVVAGEDDLQALGRGSSLARRESVSRVLYFKDGNASFEYNEKFGQGRLAETVLGGLEQSAKSAGLMKLLGTNPEATVTRLFDEYAESLRGDPARRAKFLEYRGELENLLSHVDGRANVPGNVTAAKISSFVRSWVSMTKLGGALISSVTDLSNYAAELRFGQDKNLFSGTLEGIGAVTQGRASGEKKQVLSSLGVFHESTLGAVFARFDSPELMGGKTAAAMQTFFKLTGLNWWTESLRDGYALTHSHYLATNAGQSFDKLPEALRDMLGLYNIDAGKWDVLRIATMQQADGRVYMTPEGLKTVPRAALENYITSIGRTVSDASVANLQDDLASALRTMTIDRMHHAVIEPGARTRAFMLRGTKPGTVPGELLRFATQFKSFPVALIQSTLGREVYGRGYDTLGDYLKNGKGDMVGMATFLALSMSMGYAAMSIKDLLKGRNPRPVDDPRTWAAAFIQGGGLGIYGDFLFGKYNRMGGTLSGSLIGPAANLIDTAADLWTRVRTGDDVAGTAFKALIDNTPFLNLFYTRAALDYLVLYKVQEALNPGFLRRMEKRIERENGQTFYLPPTAAL